uniref:Neuropilin-2-like isoform X2 n=1 Tax=Petromyzon marinus TaxID=7757 RepID=A0AAJ7U7V9_PETMA|nr:neuropilin-2-like isoform X2 [Petromyzon marinus]
MDGPVRVSVLMVLLLLLASRRGDASTASTGTRARPPGQAGQPGAPPPPPPAAAGGPGGTATCGGEVSARNAGYITSPGFPDDYQPYQRCEWLLRAPESDQKIILNFNPHFDLEKHDCRFDYIEVRDGAGPQAEVLGRYCGNVAPPPITSSGPALRLSFVSDYTNQGAGFSLHYEILTTGSDECSQNLTESTGVIQSPGYPDKYPHYLDCTYVIQAPPRHEISLDFDRFDVEEEGTGAAPGPLETLPCRYDWLEIWDGLPQVGFLLGRFCGPRSPGPVHSATGTLSLVLHTDTAVARDGFLARYGVAPRRPADSSQCGRALGVESGAVRPGRLSASSQYRTGLWGPERARLNHPLNAWTPLTDSSKEWLQVDLGFPKLVTGIATQGAVSQETHKSYYVTEFRLEYSSSGDEWVLYREGRSPRDFEGNEDGSTVVRNSLAEPFVARHVRLRPTRWREGIALRLELYGCQIMDFPCSELLGMVSGRIEDRQVAVSSSRDFQWAAGSARLLGSRFGWAPALSQPSEWLQVDLGVPWMVSGVLLQGAKGGPLSDTKFFIRRFGLAHSLDGITWHSVRDANSQHPKSFIGNFHTDKVELRRFPAVLARLLRVLPEKWAPSGIGLRLELLGCTPPTEAPGTGPTPAPPAPAADARDPGCLVPEGECRTEKPSVVLPSEPARNRPVSSDQAALGTEIHSSWDDDDDNNNNNSSNNNNNSSNNSSNNNNSNNDDDDLDNGGVDEPDDVNEVAEEEEEEEVEEEDARVLRSLDPILITIITVSSLGVLLGAACTGLLLYCACAYGGGGGVVGTGGRRHHLHHHHQQQQQQLNRSHGGGGGGRCVPELSISALERYNFELYDGAGRAKEKKTPCIREAGGAGQLAEEKARLHTQGSSSEA